MPQCNLCDSLLDLSRRLRATQGSDSADESMGMAATCPACYAGLNFGCCTPEAFRQIKHALANWRPGQSACRAGNFAGNS